MKFASGTNRDCNWDQGGLHEKQIHFDFQEMALREMQVPGGTWRPEKDQILQKRRIYDYEKLIISAFSFLGMSEKNYCSKIK